MEAGSDGDGRPTVLHSVPIKCRALFIMMCSFEREGMRVVGTVKRALGRKVFCACCFECRRAPESLGF